MHDAFGQNKMGAERIRRPKHDGIPIRGFPGNQRLRMAGAIEQEIGAEIFRDVVGDGFDPVDHGIGDAVCKSGQRHRQRIDDLLLRIPFCNDAIGYLPIRRNQRTAGRRADRLVVERDGKAIRRLGHAGMGVKAPAARRARRTPHRLLRIVRGFSGQIIERFAHPGFSASIHQCSLMGQEYDKAARK